MKAIDIEWEKYTIKAGVAFMWKNNEHLKATIERFFKPGRYVLCYIGDTPELNVHCVTPDDFEEFKNEWIAYITTN